MVFKATTEGTLLGLEKRKVFDVFKSAWAYYVLTVWQSLWPRAAVCRTLTYRSTEVTAESQAAEIVKEKGGAGVTDVTSFDC